MPQELHPNQNSIWQWAEDLKGLESALGLPKPRHQYQKWPVRPHRDCWQTNLQPCRECAPYRGRQLPREESLWNSSHPNRKWVGKKGQPKKLNHDLPLRPIGMIAFDPRLSELTAKVADVQGGEQALFGSHATPYFQLHRFHVWRRVSDRHSQMLPPDIL